MATCKFPLCVRIAADHGLCIAHRIYKDSGIPDPKPEKPENPEIPKKLVKKKKAIKDKTPKQRKLEAELRKMAKSEREAGHTDCEIRHPDVCQGTFDGWHHKQKKTPSNYTKRSNLLRSCNPCNTQMEKDTAWGIENGFIISKHKKS